MSLNKFQFIGNLTRDAELAPSQNGGTPRARVRLAVNQTWTDNSGAKQERGHFFSVTVWGKDAENAAKYLGKGSSVYVEGRLESSEYEKDGQKVYATDLIASHIQYLNTQKPGGEEG